MESKRFAFCVLLTWGHYLTISHYCSRKTMHLYFIITTWISHLQLLWVLISDLIFDMPSHTRCGSICTYYLYCYMAFTSSIILHIFSGSTYSIPLSTWPHIFDLVPPCTYTWSLYGFHIFSYFKIHCEFKYPIWLIYSTWFRIF